MPQSPEYPSTFLRGIPNNSNQYFDNRGNVNGYVFRPHSEQLPVNGVYKQSINWEDDDSVEAFTLSSRRHEGNTLRYRGGLARASREEVDRMMQEAPFIGAVDYNREPIAASPEDGIVENIYHGNLLLEESRMDINIMKKALFSRLKRTIIEVIPPIADAKINTE